MPPAARRRAGRPETMPCPVVPARLQGNPPEWRVRPFGRRDWIPDRPRVAFGRVARAARPRTRCNGTAWSTTP